MEQQDSRDLELLDEKFRTKVLKTLEQCLDAGYEMVPYFTVRTPATQSILWRQSRSSAQIGRLVQEMRSGEADWLADVLEEVGPRYGPRVTGAPPGRSWHQWAQAVDCYLKAHDEIIWNGDHPGYRKYAGIAMSNGLTAGYYFASQRDSGHLQLRSPGIIQGYTWKKVSDEMEKKFGSDKSDG